ncbi:molecular chaperone [Serratia fonticola]|uniref:fimbrial biogenesis chaperone n=1 Tax=Serratia fonticola TaxID=47917 RepID=UPI00192D1BB7|nr:molecular chaperone [Serratia fonticola]MBL5825949.1 molecular chaperone [Serratia fonticola]
MNLLLPRRFIVWGFCLLATCFQQAYAQTAAAEPKGISFHVLRVVYHESEKKGVTLTAYNKTSAPYLMQSRILPVDLATGGADMGHSQEKGLLPFIVTPPLARLEANQDLTLRIRRNGEPLPTDRESVFFISMKAIPAQTDPEKQPSDSRQMVLTVVNNIKVFYRPEGLEKRAVADVAKQLRFQRTGNALAVDNPTPYWLTFSRLKVGKAELSKAQLRMMVPPKGQQHYILPEGALGDVSWQLIDEDGWNTPVEQRSL